MGCFKSTHDSGLQCYSCKEVLPRTRFLSASILPFVFSFPAVVLSLRLSIAVTVSLSFTTVCSGRTTGAKTSLTPRSCLVWSVSSGCAGAA